MLHIGAIPARNQTRAMASRQGSAAMPHGSSRNPDEVSADPDSQARVDTRVFLLSPARIGGPVNAAARTGRTRPPAVRLRKSTAIGEVYAFISGLYFRGIRHSSAFGSAPAPHCMVIVPGMGLWRARHGPDARPASSRRYSSVEADNTAYSAPLPFAMLCCWTSVPAPAAGASCSAASPQKIYASSDRGFRRALVPGGVRPARRGHEPRRPWTGRYAALESAEELSYVSVQGRSGVTVHQNLKPLRKRLR